MAYKQPYKKVKNNNDGASEPITAAILGALKLGKMAAAAAKAGKVAATAAKAGKTLGTAAKAAKGAGKVAKGAGKLAKSGKKGGKVFKKIGEAGKKALEKGKSIVEKGTEKIDKFKEGYDNVAGKIADKTGFDKDMIKEFGTNQASNAASKIQDKIQSGGADDMQPAERGIPSGITPQISEGGGYSDPYGPNMFDHRKAYSPIIKSKYDNVGASMKPITITDADDNKITYRRSNDGASNSGIQKGFTSDADSKTYVDNFGNKIVRNFSAPITIKGVTFDAGDALRLGILGYKAGKEGIEKHRLKERGGKKFKGERKLQRQNIKAASKPKMSLEERRKKIILGNAKNKPTMAQNVTKTKKYDNQG